MSCGIVGTESLSFYCMKGRREFLSGSEWRVQRAL